MKTVLLLLIISVIAINGVSQSYTSYFTGSTTDMIVSPTPSGGICLMGGASENDEAMKWFLTRAYGGDVLVIRASGSDGYNDYLYTDLGITVNSVETIVFNNATAANDPYVHDRISKAEAIWMAGGDQWDYISYWRNTPVDSLINEAIANRGIVIGGTSAGMAVQGGYYFSAENGTVTSATALQNPMNTNVTVDSASFIKNNYLQDVITDTHYDNPDRKGRHVVFLAHIFENYGVEAKGIACNEYTAVCIDENGIARVFGEYPAYEEYAYFIAKNCELNDVVTPPEVYSAGIPLTWNYGGNILKVYKVPGTMTGTHTFDLNDWLTGSGGEWFNWSVNNGNFIETSSTIPLNCSLSTHEMNADEVLVSPNPTDDFVALQFNSAGERKVILRTMSGQICATLMTIEANPIIDLTHLDAGIYLLEIRSISGEDTGTANYTTVKRVVKN